jgi:hypothetical protein
MKRIVLGIGVATYALSLTACGENQPETNIAAEETNAVSNLEAPPEASPAGNVTLEEIATDLVEPEPASAEPAPAKRASAPPKPKLEQTPAKRAATPAAETKTAHPACAPEHRAAGHC